MQKKQRMLLILTVLCLFSISAISAATTMNLPVAGGNYTTTLTINVTAVGSAGAINFTNLTCYYNATGGPATTFLKEIVNGTQPDLDFTSTVSIAALSDAATYNISCDLYNGSTLNTTVSNVITIDNTAPVLTLTSSVNSLELNGLLKLDWTSTDALSGLSSTVLTLTSPNTQTCPTQTWTTASGTDTTVDNTALACAGTYTLLLTGTDKAGNIQTSTKDITVIAGGSLGGSASSSGSSSGVPVEGGYITGPGGKAALDSKTIAIIAAIILVVYFGLIKKN